MGSIQTFKLLGVLLLAVVTLGCQGPKGDQGPAGAGKIVATMNCQGEIDANQPGIPAFLDKVRVEYDAVLTAGGDVYSTAVVIDVYSQTSGTAFYAANQNGAQTATVFLTTDLDRVGVQGEWEISLNRSTLQTSVVYDDPTLMAPVQMKFNAAACKVQNW